MADHATRPDWEVTNQVPVLAGYDAFAVDPVLPEIVSAFGADWARERLHEAGRTVGSARAQELAYLANRYTPELRAFDRFGNRIDEIAFHPAWHELMGLARHLEPLRSAAGTGASQDGRDRRHGDDRDARRLRPAADPDGGRG